MPFDMDDFGKRLRTARLRAQWSQGDLADAIQANRSWISGLEIGQQKAVRAETVVRCAEALQVSTDYLLGLSATPARSHEIQTRITCQQQTIDLLHHTCDASAESEPTS